MLKLNGDQQKKEETTKCDRCEVDANTLYQLKQHKRDAHRNLAASVTPPPKKRKDPEIQVEKDIEKVMLDMENLNVKDNKFVFEVVRDENKVPTRLTEMLRIKGLDINDHKLRRIGEERQCGVKCVSLHITGNKNQATEIRNNVTHNFFLVRA